MGRQAVRKMRRLATPCRTYRDLADASQLKDSGQRVKPQRALLGKKPSLPYRERDGFLGTKPSKRSSA